MLEKKRYAYTVEADLSVLTPAQTVPYVYGDANWKDKLTAYDGKAITYDAIGNPLGYDGWAHTWKAGRMLHSMVRGGEDAVNAQFTYDHTGLRVKKTVNGVDTLYTLNGSKITHIRKGTNGASGAGAVQMHFFYDAQGRPMMVRYNGTDYAYLHNLQGDIISIVDMSGTAVVEYGYDAWGKPISTEGSMAGTLGYDNPFRYRGYVWDEETGLYYLRSRYYDPAWGRWLNTDTLLGKVGALLSQNVFTYCVNNPVIMVDSTGLEPEVVFGVPFHNASEFTEAIEDKRPGYVGYIDTPARIIMPNGVVIEGEIRQTPEAYHFDYFADDKDEFRAAGIALGAPYATYSYKQKKPIARYDPGIPIIFEVDYPDKTMRTWAMVHNNDGEDEVCVWILGSRQSSKKSIGRDDEKVRNAPSAYVALAVASAIARVVAAIASLHRRKK